VVVLHDDDLTFDAFGEKGSSGGTVRLMDGSDENVHVPPLLIPDDEP
jgi:uncharacterized protein (DUF2126 family)